MRILAWAMVVMTGVLAGCGEKPAPTVAASSLAAVEFVVEDVPAGPLAQPASPTGSWLNFFQTLPGACSATSTPGQASGSASPKVWTMTRPVSSS